MFLCCNEREAAWRMQLRVLIGVRRHRDAVLGDAGDLVVVGKIPRGIDQSGKEGDQDRECESELGGCCAAA